MNMKDGVHLAQFETEEGLSPSDRRPLQRPLSAAPDLAVVQETSPQTIGSSGSADFTSKKPHLFDMRLLAESLVENTTHYEASSLEDALHNFRLALEDYQGQYPELRNLEEQVIVLDRMIRVSYISLFVFIVLICLCANNIGISYMYKDCLAFELDNLL